MQVLPRRRPRASDDPMEQAGFQTCRVPRRQLHWRSGYYSLSLAFPINTMLDESPLFTIVLAAGKGRRMHNRYMHKVCFDVVGVPTIIRALDTFNRLGAVQNVVVVGEMAGQVV